MTESTQRPVQLVVGAVVLFLLGMPSRAQADSIGTIVVTGKVAARERAVIESAIVNTVRQASWSLSVQPFAPKEVDAITRCLRDDQPWHCLSPLMQPRAIDRIIVAEATPQPEAGKLVITGEFVTAGESMSAIAQKRCDACDDTQLAAAARRLAEELLHNMAIRAETALALQTIPSGSAVSLDGQSIGVTDQAGKLTRATYPGPHRLVVQHDGFVTIDRNIDLPVAKTTSMDVELTRDSSETTRPYLVPVVVTGAGVLALGAGITLQATKDPPPLGQVRQKYIVSGPGIGLMTVGGVAIGAGVYLWVRMTHQKPPSSLPTASLTAGGGVLGWTGSF